MSRINHDRGGGTDACGWGKVTRLINRYAVRAQSFDQRRLNKTKPPCCCFGLKPPNGAISSEKKKQLAASTSLIG